MNGRSILIQNAEVAVHRVEKKLLFIPVFFILLRMWSSVYAILAVEIGVRWRCNVSIFFIFASVSAARDVTINKAKFSLG